HVAVSRDEDDGHIGTLRRDAPLYVEASKTRKPDVEHEAARREQARTREELLCGLKGLGLPPGVTNQYLQRLTQRDVAVHDEHYRWRVSSFQVQTCWLRGGQCR